MSLNPMELYHEADKLLDTWGRDGWKEGLDKFVHAGPGGASGPDARRLDAMVKGRAAVRGWF